jgi:hypothetical protein
MQAARARARWGVPELKANCAAVLDVGATGVDRIYYYDSRVHGYRAPRRDSLHMRETEWRAIQGSPPYVFSTFGPTG